MNERYSASGGQVRDHQRADGLTDTTGKIVATAHTAAMAERIARVLNEDEFINDVLHHTTVQSVKL